MSQITSLGLDAEFAHQVEQAPRMGFSSNHNVDSVWIWLGLLQNQFSYLQNIDLRHALGAEIGSCAENFHTAEIQIVLYHATYLNKISSIIPLLTITHSLRFSLYSIF